MDFLKRLGYAAPTWSELREGLDLSHVSNTLGNYDHC
jgi:hypothetical protein